MTAADDGFLIVTKLGALLPVSAEIYPVRTWSPAEVAAAAAQHAADRQARALALTEFWTALCQIGEPHTAAVLALHAPDFEARQWATCPVCDGNEMDPGDWPCRTVTAIAAVAQIEVPS